jgi:hypothetical protein
MDTRQHVCGEHTSIQGSQLLASTTVSDIDHQSGSCSSMLQLHIGTRVAMHTPQNMLGDPVIPDPEY